VLITGRRRRRLRRLCAAGAGGAATAKTCACAAKLRPCLQLLEGASPREVPCFRADAAGNIKFDLLLICRVPFSCCGSVASPQETVWAPALTPRSRTYAHVDNRAPTQEATPRLFAAGAGGATTASRGSYPQTQAAQQRLNNAPSPPSYGQVSKSSKVRRRKGYLASVRIKLLLCALLFY
jgi:hypothetical protein